VSVPYGRRVRRLSSSFPAYALFRSLAAIKTWGILKIIAATVDSTVIAKILTHLGLPALGTAPIPTTAIRPTPNSLIRIR
jgi:hypothetical protein